MDAVHGLDDLPAPDGYAERLRHGGENTRRSRLEGNIVLLVHQMTKGRIRYLRSGEEGPKAPAFRLRFQGGGQFVLTEVGAKKRAGVWLLSREEAEAELAHLGPDALGLGPEKLGEILAG